MRYIQLPALNARRKLPIVKHHSKTVHNPNVVDGPLEMCIHVSMYVYSTKVQYVTVLTDWKVAVLSIVFQDRRQMSERVATARVPAAVTPGRERTRFPWFLILAR